MFEQQSIQQTERLYKIETGIWLLTLLLLILEVLLIFEPMRKAVMRNFEKLQSALVQSEYAEQKAVKATRVKAQFLANMSHELRTPMTGLFGMLDLALAKPQKAPTYIRKAQYSGRLLLELINDILDFEKIEAGKMEISNTDFSLLELMESFCTQADALCRAKGLKFEYKKLTDLPSYINSDPSKLNQVLNNLMTNAVKFTEQGSIRIEVSVSVKQKSHWLEVSIIDSGIGIAENNLRTIFHDFTQADAGTSRKYGGTGLGLSIVSKLIDLLGGEISVESRLGSGTRFDFNVPVKLVRKASQRATKESQHFGSIAVVDDLAATLELINEQAKAYQLSCFAFDSGNDFLSFNQNQNVDVLFLDYCMPNMDGFDVLSALKQSPTHLPKKIYMITAAYDTIEVPSDLASIVTGIIKKPLKINEIQEVFESINHSTDNSASLKGTRVLVVEDNEINAEIVTNMLENNHCSVEVATTGKVAINVLLNKTFKPDIILMDMQMPEMDGLTATKKIRNELQLGLPILGFTANASESDRKDCLDAGMNEVLTKPIDPKNLIWTVSKYKRNKV